MKNISPFKLAIFSALAIAIISGLIFSAYDHFTVSDNLRDVIILILIIFLCSFMSVLLVLDRFIYRKIKLIYKIIHNLKTGQETKSKRLNLSSEIIGDTEKKVEEWAKNYEAEIEQMKKAEIYRKEFLSNVSHELKTPIFNIQGYIHTLIDGGLHDPDINEKYLHKAAKHLDNLTDIVNDLEVISGLESGGIPLNMKKFDIYSVAKEVLDSFELQARQNNITLGFKPGCATGITVFADFERIKQVLTNLVSNSIKYGKENGKTLVSIYYMSDNVLVEVTDDGIGIAQDHLLRLFERFYRVDKSRSRKEGGTGLGLAIVKHIIEAHGQTVNVRSTLEVGSTFGFTLKKA